MYYPHHQGMNAYGAMPPQIYSDPYHSGGQPNMQFLQYLIASLIGGKIPGSQDETKTEAAPQGNPYIDNIFRPTPMGLSPIDRYNAMVLQQQASQKKALEEGRAAVESVNAANAQKTEFENTPALAVPMGQSASVAFAPPGMPIHGSGFDGVEGGFQDFLSNRHHIQNNPVKVPSEPGWDDPGLVSELDKITKKLGLAKK